MAIATHWYDGEVIVMTNARSKRLDTLEALRGIAALLVVLYHLQDISRTKAGITPFGGAFGSGDRGVDLFFVLSGFIIMTTHAHEIGLPGRLLPYLHRRSCRIFPGVWIMTLVAAVLYAGHFGGAGKVTKLEPWSITASALLLPQAGPALVNVTWTLKYEIFFYGVFSLLIVNRRIGFALLLGWQGVILLTALGIVRVADPIAGYYLRPICLEFGIGMACAWMMLRQDILESANWLSGGLLAVGVTGFAGGLLYETFQVPHGLEAVRLLVFGGSSGAIVLGLSQLERRGRLHSPAFLTALGGVSYAVYLVHYSVITISITILVRIGWIPLNNAVLIGCAVSGVLGGVAFHHLIDQPIQTRLRWLGRRLFDRRTSSSRSEISPEGLTIPLIDNAKW